MNIDFEGTIKYCRVFDIEGPGGKDMGENLPEGSDSRAKFDEAQGYYSALILVSEETADDMKAKGIPTKGLVGQLWKEVDGQTAYKIKREHFNVKLTGKDGEQGVTMGAPSVYGVDSEGQTFNWDPEEHGLIGNNSRVKVRVSGYTPKGKKVIQKVTWEKLKVLEHVEWETSEDDF